MRARRGFTLVEMLAVVAIIAILATMLFSALGWAMNKARYSRTESLIRKLDNQLAMRLEDYESRRVPLAVPAIDPSTGNPPTPDAIGAAQLLLLREMMRMEMPDLYEDLQFPLLDASLTDFGFTVATLPGGCTRPPGLYVPAVTRAYQQRVAAAGRSLIANGTYTTPAAALAGMASQNQSAEMLYLIMTTANLDEDAGGQHFSAKDTGDTDADGMLEFVDAWGQPIEWIRWPSGFSNLETISGAFAPWGFVSDKNSGEAYNDPDPFNPRRIDLPPNPIPVPPSPVPVARYGFVVHPLVVSAGADGEYGIVFRRALKERKTDPDPPPADEATLRQQYSDPFYFWQESFSGVNRRRGMPARWSYAKNAIDDYDTAIDGDGLGEWVHQDNVTNHLTLE